MSNLNNGAASVRSFPHLPIRARKKGGVVFFIGPAEMRKCGNESRNALPHNGNSISLMRYISGKVRK